MPDRVAVVIPCFNDGAYVIAAVESVREPEPVEVVVVDDGSTDPATLRAFDDLARAGVRVEHRPNGGVAAARMTGVGATTAPYVFPLDADDELEPGCLTVLADALDADPTVALAYGHLVFTGDLQGRHRAQPWDAFTLLYANRWGAPCLYRRSALLAVGGWSFHDTYEDWDLLLALAEHGYRGKPVDQVVLYYRHYPGAHMNHFGQQRHAELYRMLVGRHPALFARRHELARAAGVPPWRQLVYPLLLGSRPLYPFALYRVVQRWRSLRSPGYAPRPPK